MNKEMNSLKKNQTWKLVEKPKNEKVFDLKRIYTKKNENVYKVRIVVRGFQQTEVLDDILMYWITICENLDYESFIVILLPEWFIS